MRIWGACWLRSVLTRHARARWAAQTNSDVHRESRRHQNTLLSHADGPHACSEAPGWAMQRAGRGQGDSRVAEPRWTELESADFARDRIVELLTAQPRLISDPATELG